MSTAEIVALLVSERDRLNRAIEILGAPVKRRGRPPGRKLAGTTESVTASVAAPAGPPPTKRKRRKLSPEARKRISEAQKKRWAKAKKASK